MRPENRRMQDFLRSNGVNAVPWYITKGSMKGCWRIYGKESRKGFGCNVMHRWTMELADKLNGLGFVDYDGKPLGQFSGNGGMFQTFIRGHYELLGGIGHEKPAG